MIRRVVCIFLWSAVFCSFAAADEDGIPEKALDKLKAATVLVKVDGRGLGTGVLLQADADTTWVATSAYKMPKRAEPYKYSVVVSPPSQPERSFPTTMVATDGDLRVTILKLDGKDVPKGLDLAQHTALRESMTVFSMALEIADPSRGWDSKLFTARKGWVPLVNKPEEGTPSVIQLGAPDLPIFDDFTYARRGGPITDSDGNFLGIAGKWTSSDSIIEVVTPGDLLNMVGGKLAPAATTVNSVKDGVAEVNIAARLDDPLKRLKKAEVRYIRKDALKEQPTADKKGVWPELPDADTVALKVEDGEAKTLLTLKSVKNEKKRIDYFMQVVYVNGEGKKFTTLPVLQTVDFRAAAQTGSGEDTVIKPAKGVGSPTGKDFAPALNIGQLVQVEVNPKLGILLAITPEGLIRRYSYPDLKRQGDFIFADEYSPYRLTIDSSRSLVYAAVAKTKNLPLPKLYDDPVEAEGNIVVIDLAQFNPERDKQLKPAAEIKLGAVVRSLSLSPDAAFLYCLDVKSKDNARLIKIDISKKKVEAELKLDEMTQNMFVTADGKAIYAGAAPKEGSDPPDGRVQKISAADFKLVKRIPVALDPLSIVADNDGLLFASGGMYQGAVTVVVDTNEESPTPARWQSTATGGSLALAPTGSRIYISARSPNGLRSFDVPGTLDNCIPFVKGAAFFAPIEGRGDEVPPDTKPGGADNGIPITGALYVDRNEFPLAGALYMSPDGKCLIDRAGDVFWTAAAKASK